MVADIRHTGFLKLDVQAPLAALRVLAFTAELTGAEAFAAAAMGTAPMGRRGEKIEKGIPIPGQTGKERFHGKISRERKDMVEWFRVFLSIIPNKVKFGKPFPQSEMLCNTEMSGARF